MQDLFPFLQHHWQLSSALILILIVLLILEWMKQKRQSQQLSPQQVVQYINHQNAAIVDIRSTDLYHSGHIVDAVSLPLAEFKDKIKKLEKFKQQPIVIVCTLGTESMQAIKMLEGDGFTQVFSLLGGLKAWRMADLPLVKE